MGRARARHFFFLVKDSGCQSGLLTQRIEGSRTPKVRRSRHLQNYPTADVPSSWQHRWLALVVA
jgi:hypothetical protein